MIVAMVGILLINVVHEFFLKHNGAYYMNNHTNNIDGKAQNRFLTYWLFGYNILYIIGEL